MKREKEGILLESGTNEIEIMKFTIQDEFYGINVAKVKEIMMSQKVKSMPHANPSVEGIFKPRDTLITVIDLACYLSGAQVEKGARDLFIYQWCRPGGNLRTGFGWRKSAKGISFGR